MLSVLPVLRLWTTLTWSAPIPTMRCVRQHYTRGRMSVQCRGNVGSAVLDRDLLRHVLSNFRQQLAWAVRFRHAVVTADRPRLLFFATERIGRDRDDWDRSQGGIGPDLARGGVAVHDWQLDIHQNEIGRLLCDCRQRLLAVFGLRDFVVGR